MLPSFLPVGDAFSLECRYIGQEKQPLVVAQDFLRDVDAVKEYAASKCDFAKADEFYPGVRMVVPSVYRESLLFHLGETLSAFFGIHPSSIASVRSTYSIVTTPATELQFLQKIPHFDVPLTNGIAILHYLCDMPGSGTSFYRHRGTGFEYIDGNRAEPYFSALDKQFAGRKNTLHGFINDTTEEFEKIAGETAVCNRLLVYRGSSLHSGAINGDYKFDSNPRTGRLTITSFLQAK